MPAYLERFLTNAALNVDRKPIDDIYICREFFANVNLTHIKVLSRNLNINFLLFLKNCCKPVTSKMQAPS